MTDLNSKLQIAKANLLNHDNSIKNYTLRLPTDLSARFEALAEYSGKPKNTIFAEMIDLGMTYFVSSLDEHERFEIGTLYDEHKEQMMIDGAMGNK